MSSCDGTDATPRCRLGLSASLTATHSSLQLGLVHSRSTLYALSSRLCIQLAIRATPAAAVRPKTAPTSRRDVRSGRWASGPSLSRSCSLLVHCASRDLLSDLISSTACFETFLDVFVLPFSLLTPRRLRHRTSLSGPSLDTPEMSSNPAFAGSNSLGRDASPDRFGRCASP
jgi:hypothetical protein